jgi:hypothetical protein
MIIRAIENAFRHAKDRGWTKTYWAFDIHGTLLKPNHRRDEIATEFYPLAIEVMQMLSKRTDIVRILYTCSYPLEIDQYLELFRANGIHFHYVNTNPEVADGGYGYYKEKFYFNVLFEDKAGFSGETDWIVVKDVLKKY